MMLSAKISGVKVLLGNHPKIDKASSNSKSKHKTEMKASTENAQQLLDTFMKTGTKPYNLRAVTIAK